MERVHPIFGKGKLFGMRAKNGALDHKEIQPWLAKDPKVNNWISSHGDVVTNF